METPREAAEHVRDVMRNASDDDHLVRIDRLYGIFNLEEYSEEIETVINEMLDAVSVKTTRHALEGDIESAAAVTGDALFITLMVGYRLGCAHTAERATGGGS